jgi:drug/metabolite transporter (DMT)-like permease
MANVSRIISRTPTNLIGATFVFISAIGFSAKAIMVKLAYEYPVDAVTLLALRMAFAMPLFLVLAVWASHGATRLVRQEWVAVVLLGLFGFYLANTLDFLGLELISAGLERLILFLYPTMVVVLSALFFRRRITRIEMLALALSYAGIAMAFVHDTASPQKNIALGTSLVFGSALAYSFYLMGSGRIIARIGAMRFAAYVMLVAGTANILQFAVSHPASALRLPLRVYELSMAMAVVSTVLPTMLLAAGIRRIGSRSASLIGSVGPVTTIALATIFLHESISLIQMLGSCLVLAGVLIVSLHNGKNR